MKMVADRYIKKTDTFCIVLIFANNNEAITIRKREVSSQKRLNMSPPPANAEVGTKRIDNKIVQVFSMKSFGTIFQLDIKITRITNLKDKSVFKTTVQYPTAYHILLESSNSKTSGSIV